MKLFLLTQSKNNGYDTYDSAVVAAETEDAARLIHPSSRHDTEQKVLTRRQFMALKHYGWAKDPNYVTVREIGTTETETPGVICASFNAG